LVPQFFTISCNEYETMELSDTSMTYLPLFLFWLHSQAVGVVIRQYLYPVLTVFCSTQFNISEDANVILTQSEHGLYAYVCIISILSIILSDIIYIFF